MKLRPRQPRFDPKQRREFPLLKQFTLRQRDHIKRPMPKRKGRGQR